MLLPGVTEKHVSSARPGGWGGVGGNGTEEGVGVSEAQFYLLYSFT